MEENIKISYKGKNWDLDPGELAIILIATGNLLLENETSLEELNNQESLTPSEIEANNNNLELVKLMSEVGESAYNKLESIFHAAPAEIQSIPKPNFNR